MCIIIHGNSTDRPSQHPNPLPNIKSRNYALQFKHLDVFWHSVAVQRCGFVFHPLNTSDEKELRDLCVKKGRGHFTYLGVICNANRGDVAVHRHPLVRCSVRNWKVMKVEEVGWLRRNIKITYQFVQVWERHASGVHSVNVHLAGAGPVERYTNACINWSGRRNQWKCNGFVICMNQDNVCSLLYFLFFFSFFILVGRQITCGTRTSRLLRTVQSFVSGTRTYVCTSLVASKGNMFYVWSIIYNRRADRLS